MVFIIKITQVIIQSYNFLNVKCVAKYGPKLVEGLLLFLL